MTSDTLVFEVVNRYKWVAGGTLVLLLLQCLLQIGSIIRYEVGWQVSVSLVLGFLLGASSTFLLTKRTLKTIFKKGEG